MSGAPNDLRAWAYLSRVAEPPCPELAALVRSTARLGRPNACGADWLTMTWRVTPKPGAK